MNDQVINVLVQVSDFYFENVFWINTSIRF